MDATFSIYSQRTTVEYIRNKNTHTPEYLSLGFVSHAPGRGITIMQVSVAFFPPYPAKRWVEATDDDIQRRMGGRPPKKK